jgi:hypothetical protein
LCAVWPADGKGPPRVTELPLLPADDELPESPRCKGWIERIIDWLFGKPATD